MFLTKFKFATAQNPASHSATFGAAMMVALLSSCAFTEAPKAPVAIIPVAVPAKPTALTDEANATLSAAEQSVIEARVKRALWTAAVEELNHARSAAKEFDSVATLRHSREAVALCQLSIAQLSKAPVKW